MSTARRRLLGLGLASAGFALKWPAEGHVWVDWLSFGLVVQGGLLFLGFPWPATPRRPPSGDHHVVLQSAGERPIQVVKVLREVTAADLVTAKGWIQGLPADIGGFGRDAAGEVARRLRGAGAEVDVRGAG